MHPPSRSEAARSNTSSTPPKASRGAAGLLGPETKTKALEKLAALNTKIGYREKWKDYSSIALSRESFWNNQAAAVRWNVIDDDWNLIGKPTDRGRWGMTPPTSNAYYTPLLNEIVFPAAIL